MRPTVDWAGRAPPCRSGWGYDSWGSGCHPIHPIHPIQCQAQLSDKTAARMTRLPAARRLRRPEVLGSNPPLKSHVRRLPEVGH